MTTKRRDFLSSTAGLALGGTLADWPRLAFAVAPPTNSKSLDCDIAIIGGGTGGVAAALAAARAGKRVVLTETTDWLGGQLTSQAVPPDEHPWIEMFGCTRSYRALRDGIREYYRRHYPLTAEANRRAILNPGNGSVSKLCHEPRVCLAVIYEMLAPYLSNGRVCLLLQTDPVRAEVAGNKVIGVTVRHVDGREFDIRAPYFLDATELGDLLPLTKTEYFSGAESAKRFGEAHAPAADQPDNVQSWTWCFPMEYVAGGKFTIDKPAEYAFWRDYVPKLTPAWTGKLFSLEPSDPKTHEPRRLGFDPATEARGWWTYRRIVFKSNFVDGFCPGSISLCNWPQNDYWLANIIDKPKEFVAKHLEASRQLSLSLLYWLQTEVPRPDGGAGWPGLRLRPDLVGTLDGMAKYIYVRESRRIEAEFTVTEAHVGTDMRMKETGAKAADVVATAFADSVGVGSYRIDLHPSSGGDNYIDISSLPYQIPLGSLIPKRVENLLPTCKNLGVTHITNGCYRLHPTEWNIGESAALLAAWCIDKKKTPRAVRNSKNLFGQFQQAIVAQGVEIGWPKISPR